jgi:hypothetical protein
MGELWTRLFFWGHLYKQETLFNSVLTKSKIGFTRPRYNFRIRN